MSANTRMMGANDYGLNLGNKELLMAADKRSQLFADIRDIAEQQLLLAHRIANDPEVGEEILKLMERRQAIMDKIDALSKNNSGYDGFMVKNNEPAEIIAVISTIQEYDRQSKKLIEAGRQQAGEKLGNLRNNQKASDAYVPYAAFTEGCFFDRKK